MANEQQGASGERFGTMVVRDVWASRRPGSGRVEPGQIRGHRFPHELPALMLALIALGGSAVAAYVLVGPQAALLVLVAIVGQAIAVRFQLKSLLGRAVEVTPAQFSPLDRLVRQGIQEFNLPPTRVFVLFDPYPNAFSFGFMPPYGVVLTSALVTALDEQELATVIGHELGHIAFGHTRVTILFGGADVQLGIPFAQLLIRAPFLWWMRCSELSADRAAYAYGGRVSKLISSLVKLAVGPRLYDQVRPDELARQAKEFYRGPWAVISQLQSTHPFLVSRIQQTLDFAGPPEPGHDLNLARPDGLTLVLGRDSGRPRPAQAGPPPPVAPDPVAAPQPGVYPAGPPAQPAASQPVDQRLEAWLAVSQPDGSQAWHRLEGSWFTVGRAQGNDLVVTDPRVSQHHFGIGLDGGGCTLFDLSSRNGTLLNGKPIREGPLRAGDEIQAGDSHFAFTLLRQP